MSDSSQPRKWRVKGKRGKRKSSTIVDDVSKEVAEEYAKFLADEKGPIPLDIEETTEVTKEKKKKKP